MTAESIIRGLNPRELEIVLRLLAPQPAGSVHDARSRRSTQRGNNSEGIMKKKASKKDSFEKGYESAEWTEQSHLLKRVKGEPAFLRGYVAGLTEILQTKKLTKPVVDRAAEKFESGRRCSELMGTHMLSDQERLRGFLARLEEALAKDDARRAKRTRKLKLVG